MPQTLNTSKVYYFHRYGQLGHWLWPRTEVWCIHSSVLLPQVDRRSARSTHVLSYLAHCNYQPALEILLELPPAMQFAVTLRQDKSKLYENKISGSNVSVEDSCYRNIECRARSQLNL